MPRFDSTGPRDCKEGRGLGPCGKSNRSRFWNYFRFFSETQNTLPNFSIEDEKKFSEDMLQAIENEKKILIQKLEKLKGN